MIRKLAKDNARRNAILLTAGAGAAKAAIGDLPRGAVDEMVSEITKRKLVGRGADRSIKSVVSPKGIWGALSRRGAGRALGGLTAGTATFPLFVSGMKDLKSGEKDRKLPGMAKVVGSGTLYGYGKGGVEAMWEAYRAKTPGVLKEFGPAAIGRAIPSAVAASALALGLAHQMRKSEKSGDKKSFLPAAAALGTVAGGVKGLSETVLAQAKKQKQLFSPKAYGPIFRKTETWLPKTLGRAASGAFGTLILGGILKKVMEEKKMKKHGSAFPSATRLLASWGY